MKKSKYPWIMVILILLFIPLIMGAYEDTSRINIYDFVDGDYGDVLVGSNAITIDPNASPTVTDLTLTGDIASLANNGAVINLKRITEEVTIPVGSGLDPVVATSGNLAPAGSLIVGVTFRVTDAPGGGATVIDIGRTNGGNLDEFIDGASCDVLGETGTNYINGDAAHTGIQRNVSADTLTLTTDADVTGDAMKVRIIVWYWDITVPTS